MAKQCCPTCGASMMEYKHTFSQALAVGLYRLSQVGSTNLKNLGLTRNQWDNLQKLRYWGLVEKATDDLGKRIGGTWSITELGRNFLANSITINRIVQTYRGETIAFEGPQITFSDAVEGYQIQEDYAQSSEPHQPMG